ncbi:hypothetical protein ACLG6S_01205 [Thermodesulfobacteriota bacterium B35]
MKSKKIAVVVFSVLFYLAGVAGAFAAPQWYVCNLNEVGQDLGGGTAKAYLKLTDTGGAFKSKWFKLETEVDRSLATALTAGSLSKHIKIYTDLSSGATYPTILNLYLAF